MAQGQQHEPVQFEAVPAATAVDEFGDERRRRQVDAAAELDVQVLEGDGRELGRVQGGESGRIGCGAPRQAHAIGPGRPGEGELPAHGFVAGGKADTGTRPRR